MEGELIYEGENVCLGYARSCYDLSAGDLNNGVLATGDLAMIDSDGYYYITGRKSRFLKIFGNRVNLDEVEQTLNELGYSCACVGVDDHMKIYTNFFPINKLFWNHRLSVEGCGNTLRYASITRWTKI